MKKHVVLVEDDSVHAFIGERLLKKTGKVEKYTHCTNGKELYDLLLSLGDDLPDLILLDINMPIWDGWQYLQARAEFPSWISIPTYIVSSSTDWADRDKAVSFGLGSQYIIKPLTSDKVAPLFN
ncbi:MAG: response regulator [Spirosomataceae bacterium]